MLNQAVYDELIAKFEATYGKKPQVVSYAPGRIEVLGNHTDYNEGYVFSTAINYGTFFAIVPNDLGVNRVTAGDLMHTVTFPLEGAKPVTEDTWANYVIGTVAGLAKIKPQTAGFDGMFLGNVPMGFGLSSSAALEMCTAKAVCGLYGIEADNVTLAKVGQAAEHDYAGCSCGLLDQISSLCGAYGKLVKTDFRTLKVETVDMGPDVCFLMCNPHAKHALVDGQYNSRRKACEEAAAYFAKVLSHPVRALRDVSMAEWEAYNNGLDEVVAKRAAHPIGEDERVLKGAKLLTAGDLAAFGQLLFDSHESSRVMFENSCKELDDVVEITKSVPGVLGARLSGGGFGGSVVVMVNARDAETAAQAIASAYAKKTGGAPCEVSRIQPSQGACLV
ncbi:MAG: galactokinase [Lentisphaeraceae bacterium]|nr:galactokinase [Lentisphaeraceae bacterium]